MSGCRSCVIGVEDYLIVIKTVSYGYEAMALLQSPIDSSERGFVLQPTIQGSAQQYGWGEKRK